MRKPVPGLADSGGVSFRSVNCPTRHPCHHGHRLSPDENDDATPSAQDTTFHRTAGPADPARSRRIRPVLVPHNCPTRHIRHRVRLPRLDPVATSAALADATFPLGC
ncbi:AbfB domain-containing protein [Streptomyces sp. NPDC001068]|uniref:AbfB domain-containing protein n=1 Tax=Streptomyces sp. NPDC001068 TaxID=3364544 RepID=UPI0036B6431A